MDPGDGSVPSIGGVNLMDGFQLPYHIRDAEGVAAGAESERLGLPSAMEDAEEDLMEFSDDTDGRCDDPECCATASDEDDNGEVNSNMHEDDPISVNNLQLDLEDEADDDDYSEDDESEYEFDFTIYDIEKSQLKIPGRGHIQIELSRTADPGSSRWLQCLHVKCSHEGKYIGSADGHQINRGPIRATFYRETEFPYPNVARSAFEVFDRFGFLKTELKEHPVQKGTGTWGGELDNGILFLIESITVDEAWRRNGLGTIMAKGLMAKAERLERGFDFALAIPRWLNINDIDLGALDMPKIVGKANRGQHHDIALAFFRTLGFRRVGASCCLGFAMNPNHKAHQISSADDYDPEEPRTDEEDDSDEDSGDDLLVDENARKEELQDREMSKMYHARPVHYHLNLRSDYDCLRFFKTCSEIKEKFGDYEWYKLDRENNNALHIAACLSMPLVCKWLMLRFDEGKQLRRARNMKGYTPLEALQAKLEDLRIRSDWGGISICMSDQFNGHHRSYVKCLGVLQELPHLSEDHAIRLTYGCTCGACLSGFMSPRMRFVLLTEAKNLYDTLNSDVAGEQWLGLREDYNKHATRAVRLAFVTNRALRQGYTNLFNHIASCLEHNEVPTEENVFDQLRGRAEWPPFARYFLVRDGKVQDALKLVFDSARSKDSICGDGSSMDIFADEMAQLLECRNDHEFGCVSKACGVRRKVKPSHF